MKKYKHKPLTLQKTVRTGRKNTVKRTKRMCSICEYILKR